jgi:3-isopropylmalate dehydrogenase
LGEEEAAKSIENAVINVIKNKLKGVNVGTMGCSTTEVGNFIVEDIK